MAMAMGLEIVVVMDHKISWRDNNLTGGKKNDIQLKSNVFSSVRYIALKDSRAISNSIPISISIPIPIPFPISWIETMEHWFTQLIERCRAITRNLYRHVFSLPNATDRKKFIISMRTAYPRLDDGDGDEDGDGDGDGDGKSVHHDMRTLSKMRFAIDQFVFALYAVPVSQQIQIEKELNLTV